MSFDADEEILQDFLVEAGEILELLSEQLVDLENRPDDKDLLNAIFRGFHTVKGGAGFLQLNALVECCHVAENVFDTLRNGQRAVTPELMDVVLQALDSVNEMFSQVRERQDPEPADREVIAALTKFAKPEEAEPEAAAPEPPAAEPTPAPPEQTAEPPPPQAPPPEAKPTEATERKTQEEEITDEEFEQLLDAIAEEDKEEEAKGGAPKEQVTPPPATEGVSGSDSDEITDDEFEALLDQLHGKKSINGESGEEAPAPVSEQPSTEPSAEEAPKAAEPAEAAEKKQAKPPAGDEISDEEFESLLDELHGKGQFHKAAEQPAKPAETEQVPEADFDELLKELKHSAQGGAEPSKPAAQPKPAPAKPTPAAPAAAKPAAAPKTPVKDSPPAETTVRVDTARLDDIMNMVGELVLVRNRLVRLGDRSSDEALSKAVSNLDVVTADLQLSVMKTRMQPIKKVFGRFPRVVRDLARSLKKEINLQMEGEETDLDKNLVEALADPLVHLVRNAVDHGIESPQEREQSGKNRQGNVLLAAQQEGDHILLSIADDGAGMDPDTLRAKAVERGLYDQDTADRLSDTECFNLIFMPGFSTKLEISDVSGRGVGMDVVKTKISQLNGTINIESEKSKGSRIIIKVPLTLAIMPTLMVVLEKQAFALPLVSVNEIFHLDLSRTNVVDGQEVVIVRDKALPLFHLKRWLVAGHNDSKPVDESHVVIVSVGTQRVGFVVDQLIGQEEVVIKPLGALLQGTPGMSGATITGDGRIALILDVPSLLKQYARKQSSVAG
ncbi:chemotaxis protein CheA [Zooshikella harenae]|uniref:histidine kinase n=1 Tax=Zooshikella harenae TaxID=2827238 RepID=A0ABS5ZAV9_9GAMM|nr:chemotaxis protein CheA [Zooshikella harenae]MBU2710431.1 chemotaxis protein CheA [Zooshikella harenae]